MKLLLAAIILIICAIWFARLKEYYISNIFLTAPLVEREFNQWSLIKEDISPTLQTESVAGNNSGWAKLESSRIFNKPYVFIDQWLKWIRATRKYKYIIIPYMPSKYSKSRHVYSEMYAYIWASETISPVISDSSENKMYKLE